MGPGFLQRHTRGVGAALAASCLCLVLAVPCVAADDPGTLHVRLAPRDFEAAWSFLETSGVDIAGRNVEERTIDLIIDESLVSSLWNLGEVTIIDRSRPFREIREERLAAGAAMPEEGYKTYPEVLAWMDQIQATYPQIAQKVNLTQLLGTPKTWEGRDIYAIKLSDNVTQDEDELAIVFDGLHHARELNTIEVPMDIVNTLTELYGIKGAPTQIVNSFEIWVVPVVNPDGLQYVWNVNSNWRKNRRDNGGGIFGVDLNRNYPFHWMDACGGSTNPSSETYRGPSAASEPETQTMIALGQKLHPAIYSSYHSFGREVLPPYRCANLAEPIITVFRDLYREPMNYNWRQASAVSESYEWYYNQVSTVGFLTEIGTGFQPPYSQTKDEVRRVRPGWIFLLQLMSHGPLVQGVVTDSVSGLPVAAQVQSSQVNFTENEKRACEAGFGRYGWFLNPEQQHVLTFGAEGYQAKQVNVQPKLGGVTVDVELDPNP